MNVTWWDHVKNADLYGNFPMQSAKIRTRRLQMSGHCVRHGDLLANRLVLREANQGRSSRGGQTLTYIDSFKKDTGLASSEEIKLCMVDRSVWRGIAARGDSK